MVASWKAGLASVFWAGAALAQVEFPNAGGVGLDPPPGMTASSRFAGFEDAGRAASLLAAELPAEAFAPLDAASRPTRCWPRASWPASVKRARSRAPTPLS